MKFLPQQPNQILLPETTPKKSWWRVFFTRQLLGRGALVLAVFFIGIFISVAYSQISERKLSETPKKFIAQIYNFSNKKEVLFPAVEIKAKAGVVYDLTTEKILYSKNGQQALPLASITKLMTALIVKKTLNQNDLITFTDENNNNGVWRPKELSDYTLVGSSNIGARALAMASANKINKNFVEMMNQEKERLGLSTLQFKNETGLDQSSTVAGAYGSALDIAKLHGYIVKNYPELTEATNQPAIGRIDTQENRHVAVNTNYAIDQLPGLISSKTGTTPLAGANLSIVFDVGLNHPIAIVILGSTEEERFNDTQKLTEATVTYFAEGGE